MTHRLYVDEVGNGDLKGAQNDDNVRYLSLTGVIASRSHHDKVIGPELEAIKAKFFPNHHTPQKPVVLHRRDIMNKSGPFAVLKDDATRAQFDERLFSWISDAQYTAITIAIDKREHLNRYAVWRYDPYHYCLHCLVERYCIWLSRRGLRGDVAIEARNPHPDKRLKKSYRRLWESGTDYLKVQVAQQTLTSREIKIKGKKENVAGLQLADLIAHPSLRAMRHDREGKQPPVDFGARVAELLVQSKLDRNANNNTINGYGRKWLPA